MFRRTTRETVTTCSHCGEELENLQVYECSYCGEEFCTNHRLPEKHDCPYTGLLESPFRDKVDERSKYDSTVARSRGTQSSGSKPVSGGDDDRTPKPGLDFEEKRHTAEVGAKTGRGEAGKPHREWKPDSKTPDIAPDGSLVQDDEEEQTGEMDENHTREYILWLLLTGLFIAGLYFVISL